MRIPLYNKTGTPSVQTKAQQLSPRASAGAFTSQGQAVEQLGRQIAKTGGDVADKMIQFRQQQEKIEFDFAMAEKNAETERALDEARVRHNEQAMAFIEANKDTDTTTFRANYEQFNKDFLAESVNTRADLTDNQKQAVRSGLNAQIISKGNVGAKNAFDRAQVIRGQAARESLATMIQEASSFPEGHAERVRLSNEIEDRIIKAERDGLRTGYTVQGVKVGFEALDFDAQVRSATSFAQLEDIEKKLNDSALGAQGRRGIHSSIKTRKNEIRSEMYQSSLEAIQAIELQFDDRTAFEDAVVNGTPYQGLDADGNSVVVDTSGLKQSSRISISQSALPKKFKDLDDFRTQSMVDTLFSSAESGGSALDVVESASALYDQVPEMFDKTEEDIDGAIMESAKQMANQAYREIATGEFDQDRVNSLLNSSQALIEQTIGGRNPLARNIETSEDAGKISNVIVKARGDLRTANDKMELMSRGMELANTGDLNILDIGLTSTQKKKIVDVGMSQREGNIPAQIDFLQANGVEYPKLTAQLRQTKAKIMDDSFTGFDEEDQKVLAMFTMMSMDGKEDVFNTHIKDGDKGFWKSYNVLSEYFKPEEVVNRMRVQRRDQEVQLSYNTVADQVETGVKVFEEGVIAEAFRFATFNYFGSGEEPVIPANTSEITSDIKKLTIEYIRFGVDAEDALEKASEDYFKTHQLVGNRMLKRRVGHPENLPELNNILVDNFMSENPSIADEDDIQASDLSIIPASETSSDLWVLVRDGGFPVSVPSKEDPSRMVSVTYTLEELNNQREKAQMLADERALRIVQESIAKTERSRNLNRSVTGKVR